jgi:hypothetical protein
VTASKLRTPSRVLLLEVLVPLLKRHGFRKRRFRWYRSCQHVIQLVDIQKSFWGDDHYYVNLGIYDCHAQLRTTSLVLPPGCSDDAFEFEKRIPRKSRKMQIEQIVERCGLVWLNQVASDKGMREYLRSRVSRSEVVLPELRNLHQRQK